MKSTQFLVVALSLSVAALAWAAGNPATPQPASPKIDLAQMHGTAPKTADVGDVNVPKASGPDARTVAEIVGKRTELKNKAVVVRGKVVKYTPEVMGKNWIHLRDGTGTAADGTNDVLVTSKESTKIGDVVVARGTVRTDVDLGSGYSYKVLIDEATLQK